MSPFRNIVITGASSGIGEALALDYAAPGVTLALTGRAIDRLDNVATACRMRGATVEAKAIDVADCEAMARWLNDFDTHSPIDLVVANAGISPDIDNAQLFDAPLAHRTMAVNIGGVLNTALPVLPHLVARRRGQIVIMASLAGFVGLPYAASYNASKAAIRVWGESLRYAVAHANVGVTVVCPGFVNSRITERWPYATPFIMSASRASAIIRTAVEHNRPRVTFPTVMRAGLWLVGLLPARVSGALVRRFA